ncbi:alkaline phosphatase D family protein [Thermomonospora catenispora]|uniref:alkaline phosphatase D family protein n=1 Tax=Thermomonospora catenispora TaxID=2493090 RepID=UPI001121A4D3|nr:alkaline phosphatase D family protein [Thermomonospora catenispora]TNY38133.1 alkaline phosphatase family protein [Thermomonospora catenispora]
MTELVLGPLLRHVDERTATVWVETDRPCEVEVLGATARTFTVHGHHYALVEIDGLEPGSQTPYQVRLDGEVVWPEPGDDRFPPSVIRTPDGGERLRLAFGSCRRSPDPRGVHGPDALTAYAHRLADGGEPPTALLLIGDQVYADELGEEIVEFIHRRRGPDSEPRGELADFAEYAHLYRLAWRTDPAVRWLLSTVPTYMIFDDHDVRDDWNTSHAWREQMRSLPWWRRRIVGGLGSYWIYQHLGNLSPAERAADPLYAQVRDAGDRDAADLVDAFAERADLRPDGTRWSYRRDLGATRLIVADSRCARLLTPERRAMLHDADMAWLGEQCRGDRDHLLIVSSLPYLLPRPIHHAENWNEAVSGGAWGRLGARFGERLRQAADLEHWAAFADSFRTVAAEVTAVARGERGAAPASVAFLSGDVHYSYLARVTAPDTAAPISQVVCSPLRNPLTGAFRWANAVACTPGTAWMFRGLAALAGVPRPPLRWRLTRGPWFDNMIATIEIDGRRAQVRWEAAVTEGRLEERSVAALSR